MKSRYLLTFLCIVCLPATVVTQTTAQNTIRDLAESVEVSNGLEERIEAYDKLIPLTRQQNPDSALMLSQEVLQLLENEKDEKLKLVFQLHAANTYRVKGDVEKAFAIAQEVESSARMLGLLDIRTEALVSISRLHELKGEYEKGVVAGRNALELLSDISNPKLEAEASNNLGNNFLGLSQLDSARVSYLRALRAAESLGVYKLQASALSNLGLIYYRLKDYEQAFDFTLRSCTLYRKSHNLNALATGYMNAAFYCQFLDGKADSVIPYLHMATDAAEQVGNISTLSACYNALGVQYNSVGETEKALEMHFNALALADSSGNQLEKARILSSIGHNYKNLNDRDNAFHYLDSGMSVANDIKNTELQLRLLDSYVQFHRHFSEYKHALNYALRKEALRDSLYAAGLAQIKKLEKEVSAFELEKKEHQNDFLRLQVQKRNLTLAGSVILSVLLILIAALLVLARKRDKQRYVAEMQALGFQVERFRARWKTAQQENAEPNPSMLDMEKINTVLDNELDERDMEVLTVWFEDVNITRAEAATKLNLSEDGAKSRIRKLLKKLKVNNKQEAMKRVLSIIQQV